MYAFAHLKWLKGNTIGKGARVRNTCAVVLNWQALESTNWASSGGIDALTRASIGVDLKWIGAV